jgi:predicted naringenin-chalcone synthase
VDEGIWLNRFQLQRPAHESDQQQLLDWIAEMHAAAAAALDGLSRTEHDDLRERLTRVIARCACSPSQIAKRGHVDRSFYGDGTGAHGPDTHARTHAFVEIAEDVFDALYADETEPPRDLIHVTCTGYASPSAAQELVARKGWGSRTRVTHAYHMGCYAAMPAVRLAAGMLCAPLSLAAPTPARVDIVHTEVCSLHFDPGAHTIEQLVVQSLFADGFIRYSASREPQGLRVLSAAEAIVPDTASSMQWLVGDHGMEMTLARDVPERIAGALRGVVDECYRRAGLGLEDLARSVCAVHPGGPKIIDRVRDGLELREPQVAASRAVLRDFGNMSSATLPHVSMRVLADPAVASGTPILSLAFGPGLTICAAVFRKE